MALNEVIRMNEQEKRLLSKTKHFDVTTRIWHRPSIIGLDDIVMSAKEPNLLRNDGSIYHQPDNVLFDPKNRLIYNIEYKTTGGREKALVQLRETHYELAYLFPNYKIIDLYVHDDYKIEEIKRRR